MGGVEYVILSASRIANSNRVDQSGSDDGDVVDWVKANEIILATLINTSKGPIARQYSLYWRNVSDGGSFTPVSSTGEVKWAAAADTVLVDGVTLTSGNKLCTGTPEPNWQDGLESEEDNFLPDATTYSLADEYYTEFQWGLSLDDALGGKQYEFELFDVTEFVVIGTCLAQITTYIEPTLPQTNSRIADATENWQGACDVDITGWNKSKDFILSTYATGGGGLGKVFKLQWKEAGGSFADVGAATTINYNANTTLVDKNPVGTPAGCLTSTISEENEGDNNVMIIFMESSSVLEIQWGLDISNAADDTTYEFQLVCITNDTQEVCSCSIRTAAGETTAYKDVSLKTSLESVLTYKDVALKTTIDSLNFKDIALKITLESTLTYKDVFLKTTLESALTYKDIALKTSLNSAPSYKDIALKTSFTSTTTYKDIGLKTSLHSLAYKDVALKTTLNLLNYKDVAIKTSLELGEVIVYKDITLKTSLESALTYKDISLKTSLDSLDYKDISLKTTLESIPIYKDVVLKTTLESALTYKDITLKISLHSLDYKDIVLKTSLESALTYKDISIKTSFRLLESIGYKDIALKISFTKGDFKDISIKVSLEAIVKEIINFTSSINQIENITSSINQTEEDTSSITQTEEIISSITQTEGITSSINQIVNFISKIDTN